MIPKFDRQKFREGFLQKLAEQGITPSEFGEMCCEAVCLHKEAGILSELTGFVGSLGKLGIAGVGLSALTAMWLANKLGKLSANFSTASPGTYLKDYQTLELAKAYETATARIREKNKAKDIADEKGYDSRITSDVGF